MQCNVTQLTQLAIALVGHAISLYCHLLTLYCCCTAAVADRPKACITLDSLCTRGENNETCSYSLTASLPSRRCCQNGKTSAGKCSQKLAKRYQKEMGNGKTSQELVKHPQNMGNGKTSRRNGSKTSGLVKHIQEAAPRKLLKHNSIEIWEQ